MIERIAAKELLNLATQYKAVAITGPRQSGKTTLVRNVFKDKPYINLENPDTRNFAEEDPRGFLSNYPSGAILDEVQRVPSLFSYLQQVLDENTQKGVFILTGSNNFLLQENISQSLAGRIAHLNLLPFSLKEITPGDDNNPDDFIFKGMYPPLYDQRFEINKWYANYIQTYIEKDIRQLKNIENLTTFERFVKLCAGRVGQLLNKQGLAVEAGIDNKTVNSWLSILENSFILFRLQPHHANFNKRLVKMPKLYFYDTGLAVALLGITQQSQLPEHPARGALFENFIIIELLKNKLNEGRPANLYFWRDNTGHEIDIISENDGQLFPIEIKSGKTITADYFNGLAFWQKITDQTRGSVIYGGHQSQKRSEGIDIYSWKNIPEKLQLTQPQPQP
jgi:predicted AAA+ superfamily ATPase